MKTELEIATEWGDTCYKEVEKLRKENKELKEQLANQKPEQGGVVNDGGIDEIVDGIFSRMGNKLFSDELTEMKFHQYNDELKSALKQGREPGEYYVKIFCEKAQPYENVIADTDKGRLVYHIESNQWRTLESGWAEKVPDWWYKQVTIPKQGEETEKEE